MTIRNYVTPLLMAAGISLAAAVPANAATAIFNFGANSGGLNTAVNPDIYTLASGGVTVTVRAYNGIFGTVNYSSPVDVNWAANGLGSSGNDNPDINSGGFIVPLFGEGLLLTFSQSVDLTQALFSNFDGSAGIFADDVDFEWGSPLAAGETLDPLLGVSPTGTWNGSFTGTQFFFAAKSNGGLDGDSFRLNGVTVNYAGAVPEPATWAMMLIGFGAIGFGLRRRQNIKTSVSFA